MKETTLRRSIDIIGSNHNMQLNRSPKYPPPAFGASKSEIMSHS